MQFLCLIVLYLTTLHLIYMPHTVFAEGSISHVIIVDQSGHGHFRKLQHAIDSVPQGNHKWIEIQVRAGVYSEKVEIPSNKPYISLVGDDRNNTVIQFSDGGGSHTPEYATFSVSADNFVARRITFKNIYHPPIISQAPAVSVSGDKVAFYDCGFIGVQDTLTDFLGRHLFDGCYIEGYIDFIWGYGQSMYHGCTINVTSGPYNDKIYGAGYITAQGRKNIEDSNGFVFKYCTVVGTAFAYLGRPYQRYSRVVFYKSYLSDNVVPSGWNSGFVTNHGGSVVHAEVDCVGPGSDTSQRVKWGRKLKSNELNLLVNTNTFINQDHWVANQPLPTRRISPKLLTLRSSTTMKKIRRQRRIIPPSH
ncbi:probable pectinesterase 29 [Chenopodium quinoa]|uniref:probable pectinesterase 29 n=1 Tax=Chenopodium quinoa TaxID=63459 RepID=UPI000B78F546|nr:probable pectinesterase 29 [Chenopodium quinoa]